MVEGQVITGQVGTGYLRQIKSGQVKSEQPLTDILIFKIRDRHKKNKILLYIELLLNKQALLLVG